ncbi:MAG: cytochrome b/b6 domain-containing protein [Armatimonadaceae bacterium]
MEEFRASGDKSEETTGEATAAHSNRAANGTAASVPESVPLPPPPPPTPPAPVRLVHKHALAMRWMHWINFPVLFLMIWSGILILWAYDAYPPGFKLDIPERISLYRWGIVPVYQFRVEDPMNYPVPPDQRFDIALGFQLAKGMAMHFALAWIFTLNGVAYTLYMLISGEWRYMFPRRESFGEAFKVVLHDIGLWKKPLPPGKYNHAQRIAYSGVWAMGILMVVNGLAIYKPAQLSWLVALFGGYQAARQVHFWITALFLMFFVVHIAQVIRAGWNNFRAMLTGYELKRAEEAHR